MKFTGEEDGSGRRGFSASPFGACGGELLGLFETVAIGLDIDDLGAVDEAIDEGDHAGGVGEDLVPFGEGLVGAKQDGLSCVVAPSDDLEEEVGIAAVVGQSFRSNESYTTFTPNRRERAELGAGCGKAARPVLRGPRGAIPGLLSEAPRDLQGRAGAILDQWRKTRLREATTRLEPTFPQRERRALMALL